MPWNVKRIAVVISGLVVAAPVCAVLTAFVQSQLEVMDGATAETARLVFTILYVTAAVSLIAAFRRTRRRKERCRSVTCVSLHFRT